MHGYMRIEHGTEDTGKALYEGRFDIAESDVVYAAHAFLKEYAADVNLADVRLYVWPWPMGMEVDEPLEPEDAVYTVSGNLLVVEPELHQAYDNPYPKAIELLRKGALTDFSSVDQWMHNDFTVSTFFYYTCPGWGGATTGGDTEQFIWRMNALGEGWEAARHVEGEDS